jgi:hypothetical protein
VTKPHNKKWWLRLVIPAAATAVLLVGCGSTAPKADLPQRLSTEQAQALAIMRFQNYDDRVLNVTIDVPGKPVDFHARAVIDLRDHAGFGEYSTKPAGTSEVLTSGVIAWSQSLIATTDGGSFKMLPAASDWTQRQIGQSSAVDAMLLLALQLGQDRPENPVLLQQSSARLLRTEKVDGKQFWVISGPAPTGADSDSENNAPNTDRAAESRTRYWIDEEGSMSRFEANLGGMWATLKVVDPGDEPVKIPRKIRAVLRIEGSQK